MDFPPIYVAYRTPSYTSQCLGISLLYMLWISFYHLIVWNTLKGLGLSRKVVDFHLSKMCLSVQSAILNTYLTS